MKRPLVVVALLYGGGIVLGDFVSAPLFLLLFVSLALALAALVWKRARLVLLTALLLLTGWTNFIFRTAVISPHDVRNLMEQRTELVTVRGKLSETPFHRVYEHDDKESFRTMAQIELSELRFNRQTNWLPSVGTVAVSTPGILASNFFGGQQVEVTGILFSPKPPVAEGIFDYQTYLRRQGIYYQLKSGSVADWKVVEGEKPLPTPVSDRFCEWAKRTLAIGLPNEDEPLRLLWTMTLGWKTALTGEVAEPFMRSGTMHVFAISGLHIALISGILISVLRVARVPRGVCGLIVIPLIWFYTGVTGWQASAIRSTIMMTIIIAGWSLKRPSDLLNSLSAAALIILLLDPRQLFQASFQLSFFVVLSLALFVPVLEKIRRRWLQPDPMLPAQLRPRWKRWLDLPIGWVSASFATSLAAWLGSIPLIAYYFHLFTPVSLLANLIVVPLSGFALAANLASLVVGGWFPGGAELFNHAAWLFMLLMIRVSEWAAHLPGGCFQITAPSVWAFVFYYGLLITLLAGWLKKSRVRPWAIAGLSAVAVAWLVHWQHERSATRLTILPLGGGSAIYFDAPGKDNDLLVDCGNEPAVQFVMKPFLRAQGVNEIERLLLTHGDLRHVGGMDFMEKNFPARQILTSDFSFRSPAYRKIIGELEKAPGRWKKINRSDQLGEWTVLHPDTKDRFPQGDDGAMVLLGDVKGTRVLLLSDLGRPGQKVLLERAPDLRADIVVAGLPRENEPLGEALLDAIKPRLIIVADSEFPATERASPELRGRLARRNIPVLYTREVGGVKLTFGSGAWDLLASDGQKFSSRTIAVRTPSLPLQNSSAGDGREQ